jgi:uncharacterized phage protein gp47/JayE
MAIAPRLNYFDNSGTTVNLVVSTNTPAIYLTGVLDVNTVDVQININGSGFVSDPTLVGVNLPDFTVPNLNSYPAGLTLENGVNTIELRAIDISGSVSPTTTATITVTTDVELGFVYGPPTGVAIQRYADSVEITWSDINLPGVTGYNVYASTQPGGLGSGYLRLNAQLIPSTSPVTTTYTEFDPRTVNYEFSETDISDKDLSVRLSTVNSATGVEIERKTENIFTLLTSPKYRVNVSFARLEEVRSYSFRHYRNSDVTAGTLNSDTFALIPPTVPIYYVVTAVFISTLDSTMNESRYSIELTGSPLATDVNVRGIKIRDQSTITQNYIQTLQTVAPELSLIPGSTVREVHIEPFSNEIQKAYFLMDFVHRAKSFAALLAIDDPNRTGTSIAVSDSQYKQNLKTALASPDDATVQSLIDNAFDSLAKNFGILRRGQSLAVVEQIFYTTTKPVRDLYINPNTTVRSSSDPNAPRFVSKGQAVLPALTASRYYNSEKRRYEIKVQMIADSPGVVGNVPAGTLDTVVSGASGFSTINEVAGSEGSDRQSNSGLADVASRTLVSLDTGTAGGYEKIVSAVPGVSNHLVVRSGDPFMMRDYDPVRQKHVGGKVDIYVKGTIARAVSETYAFKFSVARNVRFDVIDPINLIFRARDSRLTVDNPIEEMLFNPSQSLGLYNYSNLPVTGYDLTGVTILDYRTIKLNNLIPQPSTLLDDFIEGDYRYRSNNFFVPGLQPVTSVTSVVGEVSGALDPAAGFTLYKLQDPLLEGESTIAQNYVEIHQVDNVPSGASISVNNETHVLIGQLEESLMSVGINTYTLNVYSEDRTILYNGPDLVDPDYLIIPGTQSTPIKIVRTIQSNIPNGATVSVDYEHDENFVVTYNINDVLQRVQVAVNNSKHITADVIVKQAIENPLDIISTVQLKPKYEQSTVDNLIRTSYSNLIDSKNVGDAIHVSDVTAAIDNATGVDFVVQPFAKMTLQDGALRVRDSVANEYVFIPSLSSGTNAVYILTEELAYATTDGGGPDNVHHGVYKDNLIMDTAPTLNAIGAKVNNSYVIGRYGAIIQGYSDDATLAPVHITADAIAAARLKLTANRVLVSLDYGQNPPDDPSMHEFSITYVVNGDSGYKDIDTSQVEYLTAGNLTLTFRKA